MFPLTLALSRRGRGDNRTIFYLIKKAYSGFSKLSFFKLDKKNELF